MATHSSILAGRIPWTEESGRLQSMGSQGVGHNWSDLTHTLSLSNSLPRNKTLSNLTVIRIPLPQKIIAMFDTHYQSTKTEIITANIFYWTINSMILIVLSNLKVLFNPHIILWSSIVIIS